MQFNLGQKFPILDNPQTHNLRVDVDSGNYWILVTATKMDRRQVILLIQVYKIAKKIVVSSNIKRIMVRTNLSMKFLHSHPVSRTTKIRQDGSYSWYYILFFQQLKLKIISISIYSGSTFWLLICRNQTMSIKVVRLKIKILPRIEERNTDHVTVTGTERSYFKYKTIYTIT